MSSSSSALASRRANHQRKVREYANTIDEITYRLIDISRHAKIDLGDGRSAVDFKGLQLKKDHEKRPFWVTPAGTIYLEGLYFELNFHEKLCDEFRSNTLSNHP